MLSGEQKQRGVAVCREEATVTVRAVQVRKAVGFWIDLLMHQVRGVRECPA